MWCLLFCEIFQLKSCGIITTEGSWCIVKEGLPQPSVVVNYLFKKTRVRWIRFSWSSAARASDSVMRKRLLSCISEGLRTQVCVEACIINGALAVLGALFNWAANGAGGRGHVVNCNNTSTRRREWSLEWKQGTAKGWIKVEFNRICSQSIQWEVLGETQYNKSHE